MLELQHVASWGVHASQQKETPCSACVGIYLAVINGKCNGKGGCTATDKAQVGEHKCP